MPLYEKKGLVRSLNFSAEKGYFNVKYYYGTRKLEETSLLRISRIIYFKQELMCPVFGYQESQTNFRKRLILGIL